MRAPLYMVFRTVCFGFLSLTLIKPGQGFTRELKQELSNMVDTVYCRQSVMENADSSNAMQKSVAASEYELSRQESDNGVMSLFPNDSVEITPPTYADIRGLETGSHHSAGAIPEILTGVLFPVRAACDGLFFAVGRIAATMGSPNLISRVEDIIYFYENPGRKAGWFPVITYSSGPRFRFGAGLFLEHKAFNSNIKGYRGGKDYWSIKSRFAYDVTTNLTRWKPELAIEWTQKDEFEFFGLGADPENDSRNTVLSGLSGGYGLFTQESRLVSLQTPVRINDHFLVQHLVMYRMRKCKDNAFRGKSVGEVFDLSRYSHGDFSRPVEYLYNELLFGFDSRSSFDVNTPGWRIESYAGIAAGVSGDHCLFGRSGGELALFIPLLKRNRLLMPRITIDMVRDFSDGYGIAFTDYPRHNSFRGLNSTSLKSIDTWVVVPSLEYQWPLNHFMAGHIFYDYLAVGQTGSDIEWGKGLYAVGFGIDVHEASRELGRIQFAVGSEEIRTLVTIGLSEHNNARNEWN